jgi:hypothetical protein
MKAQNMSQAAKSKTRRPTSSPWTQNATSLEDDAEQALKEIVAASGKPHEAAGSQRKDLARKARDSALNGGIVPQDKPKLTRRSAVGPHGDRL